MRIQLSILFIITCFYLSAQTGVPTKINYQGVARDINGDPIASQNIGLQFKISS